MTIKKATNVKPNKRQIEWQKLEFYGFIHFGINTMTNKEWGDGTESPELFNPEVVDCDDWVKTMKDAGMNGAIITAKHHDGFCLWPSNYTDYSVKSSPWKNGQGDLVKEFSEACKKYDMKFGVYLSPWDRHDSSYGKGKEYDDYYVNQLKELLTNYGEVFSVWLDGANGEGPNGKKQYYDYDRYYSVVREYQLNAVISISGPDVRWIGNEAGQTRKNEWSVVPAELLDAEKTAKESQKVDDGNFTEKHVSTEEDLGSRKVLENYNDELAWYPAEVDVSIRPGWFHHEEEDDQVKSADHLFNIYKNSVGRNSTFLLNLPPNKEGQLAGTDKVELDNLGNKIRKLYSNNVLDNGKVTYSSNPLNVSQTKILDLELGETYWKSNKKDEAPSLTISFDEPVEINTFILREYIPESQRIEKIEIYAEIGGEDKLITTAEAVGYQRILEFEKVTTNKLTIKFVEYREFPTVNGVYATLNV